MAKSQQSFNKKEREKKRQKKRKEKAERKEQRKQDIIDGKTTTEEFMYVDENGNLSPTPPDPTKKTEINVEDILVSVPKKGEEEEEDPIRKGKVKFFNSEKGYGFIIDEITQQSVFVHVAGLIDQIDNNDQVIFEVEMGQKGPNAIKVQLIKK